MVCFLHQTCSMFDLVVLIGMHFVCLPIIAPQTTPRLMACIAGSLYGLIAGLQCIDLCFDFVILSDQPISDGVDTFLARQVAYLYYHTVITASHVNAALLAIVLTSFLGALVGLGRSSPGAQRQWLILGAAVVVGSGGYMTCVVPRYLAIRQASRFEASLFEGWGVVLGARIALYGSVLVSLPVLFALQGSRDEGSDDDGGLGKPSERQQQQQQQSKEASATCLLSASGARS